jgi:hypothetical protein
MLSFRALASVAVFVLLIQLQATSGEVASTDDACDKDVVLVTTDGSAPTLMSQQICSTSSNELSYVGQQSYLTKATQGTQKTIVDLWRTTRSDDHMVFIAYEEVESVQLPGAWSERITEATAAVVTTDLNRNSPHEAQKTLLHHRQEGRLQILQLNETFAIASSKTTRALSDLSDRLPRDARMTRLVKSDRKTNNVSLPSPTFKPPLHALLFSKTLDVPFLQNDARVLSGEDKFGQSIPLDQSEDAIVDLDIRHWDSRHSATPEARLAAAWIRARMARDLAPMRASCVEWKYDEIFSPNVICTIPPSPRLAKKGSSTKDDGIVVISAHYDSRGTFGSVKAPGADDDGSGTTMLLALARHLGSHQISFEREVRLVAFSGEEQGLVGSQHYAAHLRNESVPVYFQMQTDMIGYRKPGEPLQVAFPDKLATESATQYVMSIARMYVPELQLGYTPACCSDHQSFWEQGYTSTWIFERRGPIADPCYHDSCDRTDRPGYDFEQIRASTRLVLATLLDVAGGVHWPW